MHLQMLIKKLRTVFLLPLLLILLTANVYAESNTINDEIVTIDRIQLVTQQINLLKVRLERNQRELTHLQNEHDKQVSQLAVGKVNKNLLDKYGLEISVSKSNLESINIELTDTQQTINWLSKNIQEIENQLNVLSIFGLKIDNNGVENLEGLRSDLSYQQKLLILEKSRLKYLQDLQYTAKNVLQLRKENLNRLIALLKSSKMLFIKQQQVKDELAYQEQQNHWLQQLNTSYEQLANIDPIKSKDAYANTERDIFYANENANFAYSQSLIARYKDQIQQMKLAVLKGNSISLLNEIGDQVLALTKQINTLDTVVKSRAGILGKHISYLQKRKDVPAIQVYVGKLIVLRDKYKNSDDALVKLNKSLSDFRKTLDQALQVELSLRQGFPSLDVKTLLDIGKESLLVPALTFQIVKSLAANLLHAFASLSILAWSIFLFIESLVIVSFLSLRRSLINTLNKPSSWQDSINTKWLSLQCLRRNFLDLAVISNLLGVMYFIGVPFSNYMFLIYLAGVWLTFKAILTLARVCLVETTNNTAGHDVKLYRRLKWIMLVGSVITTITVFVHQLPLIYEIKTLCDCLFLCVLMVVSVFMLRSYDVLPHLILSHMESKHPYFERSIRLLGILVPLLILGNSIVGLLGFLNLIMTISWYEGIFLLVLIAYLVLRGLLSDGMEQVSRLVIQYINNGWLWTEAFLKPLDKVLRITLFLSAWVVLFLLYGWDKQSPMVVRLTRLLHYQLIHALNTTITPFNIIQLFVLISVFYWTAKWTREFVFRLLLSRTKDMGIRSSIAILSQYSVVVIGIFICLRVLGIDFSALAVIASMFAFGVGLGLRDLANNFVCGFLILLERPLRVGDIVNIGGIEGEVTNVGSRAITVCTWDRMELLVPNAEIFHKSFMNWTAMDNIVRTVTHIKISRYDNPHEVKQIIQNVLASLKEVLKEPAPEVYMKEISDALMDFEVRYFVNIRQVKSRTSVMSVVLMAIWEAFIQHGIKPPHPQQEIVLRNEMPRLEFQTEFESKMTN